MKTLPLFFQLVNKTVLIIGGGDVAYRKALLLQKVQANLVVIAKDFDDEFLKFLQQNQQTAIKKSYDVDDIAKYHPSFIISATDDHVLNQLIYQDAQAAGIAINVVDTPHLCDFIFPAIVDRNPIVIGVSSNGQAPVLARLIRAKIESWLPSGIGVLAEQAGNFRNQVKRNLPTITKRRHFWESIFNRFLTGQTVDSLPEELNHFVNNNHATGEVYIVGAGSGDIDLLTFKALRLMQQADVVLYDALVPCNILELCRRDSQKIFVGKKRKNHSKTQDEINQLLISYAKSGHRVLRLKGGDPFIFGRGGEEMVACQEAGVPYQVVSGITAALAAGSCAGIPLTHRGLATSVRFLTGCYRSNESFEQLNSVYQPDETLVFYMGLHALPKIVDGLIHSGVATDMPIAIISNASLPNQQVLVATLKNIVEKQQQAALNAPAIIIVGRVVDLYRG